MRSLIWSSVLLHALRTSAVTIYTTFVTDESGKVIAPSYTNTAVGPSYTGYVAYNTTTLVPPVTNAQDRGAQDFDINVHTNTALAGNLSIPLKGSFMGLSIELSVANQFLGRNSTSINVPFLNHLANLRQRMGHGPTIRVGGNSQEFTRLFLDEGFKNYEFLNKTANTNPNSPTKTPEVDIAIDLLYALTNITSLVDAQWYLGLAFGYPTNFTGNAAVAQIIEEVLGESLLGLQLGNEPDLFGVGNRLRPDAYPPSEYLAEMTNATNIISKSLKNPKRILAPSTCCEINDWHLQDVYNAGFLQAFPNSLSQIAVQKYPNDNCPGNIPPPPDAQTAFFQFLSHNNPVSNAAEYLPFTNGAVAQGTPFIMFETNTGSCSGWPGVSDSFASALWAVDWALQLGFSNFSNALFHFGGQNASYNAFTPPPHDFPKNFQWTTAPIYYSMLMVAEALGSTNQSRVVDLFPNNGNPLTPAYAIYEPNGPARVVLINYINDASGGSTYRAHIHVGGQFEGTQNINPPTVKVRYLSAPSVAEKYNVSYGGQTFGGLFESDGRLKGDPQDVTITCTNGDCAVPVPAPGAALVFLNDQADVVANNKALSETFSTSYFGRGAGPTLAQGVLETSNGRGGQAEGAHGLGSTSRGKIPNAGIERYGVSVALVTCSAVLGGALFVLRSFARWQD